ncbi:glycosyltransferase [Okibacterium endophyticum]
MSVVRSGVVSVVLVNFRGTDDTLNAIAELEKLEWPADKLEIVVVENGSGDDSESRIRNGAPRVSLVVSDENLGFAGGCNLGVRKSTGEYIAFLNNDARPDKRWVAEAMARFKSSPRVGAVASKVLDWNGEKVDFIGAALTWFGMGYKPLTGQDLPKKADEPESVLFGTGSAMFVRRDVFDRLGGFDEKFFMFFEDVDFGWRLNLLGYRFAYEPRSIAFHKHHASMNSYGEYRETYLLERNALFTLYKNIGEPALSNALSGALALSARRAVARSKSDSSDFDLRKHNADARETIDFSKDAVATLYGIDQFVENLDDLSADRERIQATRVVSDQVIWGLFGETDAPSYGGDHYLRGYSSVVRAFAPLDPPPATRVLIITGDPIGTQMAGPAIRAWHMAMAISAANDVRLVSLSGVGPVGAPFPVLHIAPGDEREMKKLESWADVIVFQGLAMAMFRTIRDTKKIVIADIYDPMHFEQLEQARDQGEAEWAHQVESATQVLNQQLERGDFFLCASERQRYLYLGQLAALGRINPANYADDPDLTGLISSVPFGLEEDPPTHQYDVLKGVVEGIEAGDKVLLWSGGLYNWFDPKTLIQAVHELSASRPNVRLFFQGTKHPHPGVPEMAIVSECRALAAVLGAKDKTVFFNDSWVHYAARQNYLMEADAGVSTHHSHIETTFSFRTRILDYLWAGLPMVVTEGDHFADLVEREVLGIVVPAEDTAKLAAALERVLFDEEFIAQAKANIARVREEYKWDRVLQPLTSFIARPKHAEDLVKWGRFADETPTRVAVRRTPAPHGVTRDVQLAFFYLKNGGPRALLGKVKSRLSRR